MPAFAPVPVRVPHLRSTLCASTCALLQSCSWPQSWRAIAGFGTRTSACRPLHMWSCPDLCRACACVRASARAMPGLGARRRCLAQCLAPLPGPLPCPRLVLCPHSYLCSSARARTRAMPASAARRPAAAEAGCALSAAAVGVPHQAALALGSNRAVPPGCPAPPLGGSCSACCASFTTFSP